MWSGERLIAAAIGGARVGIGTAFAARPVQSVRFLGVDTATANRLRWLAQMTAARDVALGVATIAGAVTEQGMGTALIAGAIADAADATVVSRAIAAKQVAVVPGVAVSVVAFAASAAALAVVLNGRSHRPGVRTSAQEALTP